MYSGYAILGLIIVFLIVFKRTKKKKPKHRGLGTVKRGVIQEDSHSSKTGGMSSEINTGGNNRSEYSITSAESGMASSALVLLSSPVEHKLKFDELLLAPAELVGKGRYGSLYKVILYVGRLTLAVKRIKDRGIPKEDFKKRMQKVDQPKHPHVLPLMAYYCSNQEKLLVYEYQLNGSLFSLC